MCHNLRRLQFDGQSSGHRVAVCFHFAGVSSVGDGTMTSKLTLVGPVGCRPIKVWGSTAPIVYPQMSSVKQLAAWNSSSSAKFSPGAFLSVNFDCLQHLVNCIPLQFFELSMRTNNGNFLRELYGKYEARLAGPLARKAETPLTRSTPLWRREWGRLVTTNFRR